MSEFVKSSTSNNQHLPADHINSNDDDVIPSEDIPGISSGTHDRPSRCPSPSPTTTKHHDNQPTPPDMKSDTSTPVTKTNSLTLTPKPKELGPSDFYFGVTLGEGAYARVVHGRMKRPNSPDFAIKIMEKAHIKKENKVKYVMMEKNILSKVSHPLIIKFYFSFQDAGYLYMCMDLAPGGELLGVINTYRQANEKKGIEHKACDDHVAKFYFAEILQGLIYLHQLNICHRDLKPENMLISSSGHIKITDFGTALLGSDKNHDDDNDEESMRSSFVGTAEYVSPEVLRNESVTHACDYWALGCILYQLLSGITPFHEASEYLTFQCILDHVNDVKKISYPDTIHDIARDMISQLLSSQPSHRLGSNDDGLSLKQHAYLHDISWEDIISHDPPYIPDVSCYPDPQHMRDGADEDWIFDGEATPIISHHYHNQHHEDDDIHPIVLTPTASLSSSPHVSMSKSPSSSSSSSSSSSRNSLNFFTKKHHPTSSSSPSPSKSHHGMICNDVSCFLDVDEKNIFTGMILKRVGLFSKRRQLILSDRPRLLYVDPDSLEVKGVIPWTYDHPVKCEVINDKAFDVIATKTGRKYHLTAVDTGSTIWHDLINAMLAHEVEKRSVDHHHTSSSSVDQLQLIEQHIIHEDHYSDE